MEIYCRQINPVKFEATSTETLVSAQASLNDGQLISLSVDNSSQVKEANLPFVTNEGTVKVVWKFVTPTFAGTELISVNEYYDVVTPLLTTSQILSIHPNATPDEVAQVEAATRHIINAHTGQSFGMFVGKKSVYGRGFASLRLPARLLSINTINGVKYENYSIDESKYYLNQPFNLSLSNGEVVETNGVIYNPYGSNNSKLFVDNGLYVIDGVWGWDSVPAPVVEAAKLLVNDYACSDAQYRDRYLSLVSSSDWRIQFNNQAFLNTGNVRADHLLNDYVLNNGWFVI